jgi:hypothetical protein
MKRTFTYQCGAKRGIIQAETMFKAAQAVIGSKDVRGCADWTGQFFTNPARYVGTIYCEGRAVENVECKLWEQKPDETELDEAKTAMARKRNAMLSEPRNPR